MWRGSSGWGGWSGRSCRGRCSRCWRWSTRAGREPTSLKPSSCSLIWSVFLFLFLVPDFLRSLSEELIPWCWLFRFHGPSPSSCFYILFSVALWWLGHWGFLGLFILQKLCLAPCRVGDCIVTKQERLPFPLPAALCFVTKQEQRYIEESEITHHGHGHYYT